MDPQPRNHGLRIPDDIRAACQALNWKILDINRYAHATGYLIQSPSGIIEPYSRQAILDSAQAAQSEQAQEVAA